MRTRYLSIASGLILLAGLAIAQAPDSGPSQAQPAPQANQASPLATESAPPLEPEHAPDPARMAQRLGKQLGLTPDQVAQLQPILADRQQAVASLRNDTTLAPRERRMKMRGIQQDSRSKIEALLTDSQKQQYEQMLANRRGQRRQPPPQAQ